MENKLISPHKITSKTRAGFSLVEVVVASILLALIAAGFFSITLSSQKIVNRSHLRHAAMEVAQAITEDLRIYLGANQWDNTSSFIHPDNTIFSVGGWTPWISLSLNINASPNPAQFCNSELTKKYNGRWRYQVQNVSGYDYRKVNVEVAWDEAQ